uniref:Uncharacterized protein n=1 Tax=Tetranychus urticae TaxID=32264 RepID=T1JXT9_TETUR
MPEKTKLLSTMETIWIINSTVQKEWSIRLQKPWNRKVFIGITSKKSTFLLILIFKKRE